MKSNLSPVLEDCQWVMRRTELVIINDQKVKELAAQLMSQGLQKPKYDDVEYWRGDEEDVVQYALVLEAMNWGSWYYEPGEENQGQEPRKWVVEYQGQQAEDWYGAVLALKRAMRAGRPILSAEYLARVDEKEVGEIFATVRGHAHVKRRRLILNEVGEVLVKNFSGSAAEIVKAAQSEALQMVSLLVKHFPNFRDEAIYADQMVKFNKRAQHWVMMVWGLLEGKSLGDIQGMEQLTILADYRVPQLLRHFGVLEYADELARKVDHWQLLTAGSIEEVEIRAGTVAAGEMLIAEMQSLGSQLRTFELDINLWLLSQQIQGMKPYHLVKTVRY